MKKLFTLLLLLLSLSFAKADYWTQKADFTGQPRTAAFSFSINTKGYMGTGRDVNSVYYNDFWEFDPALNTWTQKADFGGSPRMLGIGFSIAGKGYAGLGGLVSSTVFNDFWEYDPSANLWTQKADFGGTARIYPSCFVIGNMGYVGTGCDSIWANYYNDFWQYDPVADSWTVKAPVPGTLRADAVGFAIGNSGYIGTGYNGAGSLQDFWEYSSSTNAWSQIANFPFLRIDATAFTICNKGFVATGNHSGFYSDIWQYDTTSNQWIQKTDFSGTSRDLAVSFAIGNKGYLGIGWMDGGPYYIDFWEYTPDSIECTTGTEEISSSNLQFTISPNPVKELLVISYPLAGKKKVEITITNAQGKKIYESKLMTLNFRIRTSNFTKGIYFVEISDGKQKVSKKFVKE
ncbi:MAG TPA: T9SS type A sorting domain-containing protein [Bacteroidia bacterium]|nr:T9SS type A sorting domain-containing protein [Bacteroidia bacterium]